MSNEKKRPVCVCGEKMELLMYRGYYDEFNYFHCSNSDCDAMDGPVDDIEMGSYA